MSRSNDVTSHPRSLKTAPTEPVPAKSSRTRIYLHPPVPAPVPPPRHRSCATPVLRHARPAATPAACTPAGVPAPSGHSACTAPPSACARRACTGGPAPAMPAPRRGPAPRQRLPRQAGRSATTAPLPAPAHRVLHLRQRACLEAHWKPSLRRYLRRRVAAGTQATMAAAHTHKAGQELGEAPRAEDRKGEGERRGWTCPAREREPPEESASQGRERRTAKGRASEGIGHPGKEREPPKESASQGRERKGEHHGEQGEGDRRATRKTNE
jgi:hypothetical protein